MINFIILAAGRGSRLKKTTESIPKGLVKINKDNSILDHQIKILEQYKNKRIIIVVGYKSDKIIKNFKGKNIIFVKNKIWNKSNMLYSLVCAEKYLKEKDSVILYSDIIYSKSIIDKILTCKKQLCVAYDPNWLKLWKKRFKDPKIDAETFKMNKYQEIIEIGKKVTNLTNVKGQYMGILKIKVLMWRKIRKNFNLYDLKKMHVTHCLSQIIDKKLAKIKAVKNTKKWFEIDNNKDLKIAKNYLNKNILK
jgi:choline kinase